MRIKQAPRHLRKNGGDSTKFGDNVDQAFVEWVSGARGLPGWGSRGADRHTDDLDRREPDADVRTVGTVPLDEGFFFVVP